MAKDLGIALTDLVANKEQIAKINPEKYVSEEVVF